MNNLCARWPTVTTGHPAGKEYIHVHTSLSKWREDNHSFTPLPQSGKKKVPATQVYYYKNVCQTASSSELPVTCPCSEANKICLQYMYVCLLTTLPKKNRHFTSPNGIDVCTDSQLVHARNLHASVQSSFICGFDKCSEEARRIE
jgi:hypothetical protein